MTYTVSGTQRTILAVYLRHCVGCAYTVTKPGVQEIHVISATMRCVGTMEINKVVVYRCLVKPWNFTSKLPGRTAPKYQRPVNIACV